MGPVGEDSAAPRQGANDPDAGWKGGRSLVHSGFLWDFTESLKTISEKEVSSKIYEIGILAPEVEIMRETPWSRIKGQNSVDKEFLEIVGSGKPTGSVLKETIAVSVTTSISVQKNNTPKSVSKFSHAAE